ncbi:hypothetical protein Tco_1580157, partial [Tanacetum coccineum]
ASKQGKKIADIDADVEVTLVDDTAETQGRFNDDLMFDTSVLDEQEVKVEKVVSTAKVTTNSATTTTVDELTLAQTLIEIKAAKPKVKGVMIQEPSEFTTTTTTPAALKPSQDKGKEKMIELAKEKAEKDEEANISWDNVQVMIEADRLLGERLQAREKEELTDEEKGRLFVELLEKRKKHFAALRAQEKRNKPPTKAQKKTMTRANMFVDMDTELVKESSKKAETEMAHEGSSKRAGEDLQKESTKKQKIHRKRRNGYYEIMRADRSAKTYLLFSQLLKEFDREDLENLWKVVKDKHGYTMPEEAYERILWEDLKVMFEPHVEDAV